MKCEHKYGKWTFAFWVETHTRCYQLQKRQCKKCGWAEIAEVEKVENK